MLDEYKVFDELVHEGLISEPKSGYNEDKDFTSLIAWQDGRAVKLYFYQKIIPHLPKQEMFALQNQIRRAAVSVTANIAEGYGRFHFKEGIQYYRIARASLYELKDHLITCRDIYLIDDTIFQEGLDLIETSKISLNGFIKYTQAKLR